MVCKLTKKIFFVLVKIAKNIVDTCLSLFGCSKNSYFIKKIYIGFSKFGLTILLKDCKLMMNK